MNDVEKFINHIQLNWQKKLCTELYIIQKGVSAHIVGEIKWDNPYFSVNNKYLLKWYVGKGHINVYFTNGIELNDPIHLFEPTGNKKMRTIKLFFDSNLDEKAYRELVSCAVQKTA